MFTQRHRQCLCKTLARPITAAVRSSRAAASEMARRLLLHARPHLNLRTPPPRLHPSRPYVSDMRRSAFLDRLLRYLRFEIASCRAGPPPTQSPHSFAVNDRPGELWIRLHRAFSGADGGEQIKVDAAMVDCAVAPTRSGAGADAGAGAPPRLHISAHVEISKAALPDLVLKFECSAWPDEMEMEKVYAVRHGDEPVVQQYMGRRFRELDEEMQTAVQDYLEQRGVNDELAAFLHLYMENKEHTERVRWLRNAESYLKKQTSGKDLSIQNESGD